MAAKWPNGLDTCIDAGSYQETEDPQYLVTDIDNGPRVYRRVLNRGFGKLSVTIFVDKAQYIIFQSWWRRELAGGAGAFNFRHPITKELKSFRCLNPYKISAIGPRNWKISMDWGELGTTPTYIPVIKGDRTMYYTNLNNFNSSTVALSADDENFQVFAITPIGPDTTINMSTTPLIGSPPDGTEVLLINVAGSGHNLKFTSTSSFYMNGDCVLYPGRSLTMVKASSGYYEKGRA